MLVDAVKVVGGRCLAAGVNGGMMGVEREDDGNVEERWDENEGEQSKGHGMVGW
jgi:hypothetical protein